jgi:uncharacterized damage-inducible protein DinB
MSTTNLRNAIVREVIFRIYEESIPRITRCLEQLTNEQIWWRPNENSNSIGNLILHLQGNVRQWIGTGLGNMPDHRKRQTEFDERRLLDKTSLMREFLETMELAKGIIEQVPEEELLRLRPVQTFEESGLSILVHVTEHFSYHTGQIAYITKMLRDKPLEFYEGITLE